LVQINNNIESWCLHLVSFGVLEWSRSQAQQFLWWGASVIISVPTSVSVAAAFHLCSTAQHFSWL